MLNNGSGSLAKMAWNMVGLELGGVKTNPFYPRPNIKRGKYLKAATMMIMYGAGDKMTQKTAGLGRRRIRVLRKYLCVGTNNHHGTKIRAHGSLCALDIVIDKKVEGYAKYYSNTAE